MCDYIYCLSYVAYNLNGLFVIYLCGNMHEITHLPFWVLAGIHSRRLQIRNQIAILHRPPTQPTWSGQANMVHNPL